MTVNLTALLVLATLFISVSNSYVTDDSFLEARYTYCPKPGINKEFLNFPALIIIVL